MYEDNPEVRVFLEKHVEMLCKYAGIVCPFGDDMDITIDKIITEQPNNRELGNMLQGYHVGNFKKTRTQSTEDKKRRVIEQVSAIKDWKNEQKLQRLEQRRVEEEKNTPKTDPNASPFGDSFK